MRTGFPCPYCPQQMLESPAESDGLFKCPVCSLQGPMAAMKQLCELRALATYSAEGIRLRKQRIVELDQELDGCGAKTCLVQIGESEAPDCSCNVTEIIAALRIRSKQVAVAMGTVGVSDGEDDAPSQH